MSLKDRFRIDELFVKGEKAIPRDEGNRIVVRKSGGKPIPPDLPKEDTHEFLERRKRGKKPLVKKIKRWDSKNIKPYGSVPIKPPGLPITPKTKEDLAASNYIPSAEELAGYQNQESFSGETSGRIERPVYDEVELQKAKDLKVDELIKPAKPINKTKFIKQNLYDKLRREFENVTNTVADLTSQLTNEKSSNSALRSQIQSLEGDVASINEQKQELESEITLALDRYNTLLNDYQNSVIKGTKEGIERVSLTAQVKGLQAQKETLTIQLSTQQDIVKSLQQQAETQAQVAEQQQQAIETAAEAELEQAKQASLSALTAGRPQTQIKGTVAIAGKLTNKNTKSSHQVYWDDRRKGPKGILSGMKFDWFNVGTDSVTLNVKETVIKKGKWMSGVPSKVIIPASPDGGSTPGTKSMNFSRGSTKKGTYETDIVFTNTTTQETFVLKTHYWQARRRRKT